MALVRQNNNKAMVRAAGQAGALVAPALMAGAKGVWNNRQMVYDGVNWVVSKAKARKANKAVAMAPPGTVAAPVAYSQTRKNRKPKIVTSKGRSVITHREFVSLVTCFTNFTVNNGNINNDFSLNPANFSIFPWLGSMAANYDQYRFESVTLHYGTTIGTQNSGRVTMFFDKDSEDLGPDDRSALVNYETAVGVSPWGKADLNIPCDGVRRFINDNSTADPKLINLGKIGFATYSGNGLPCGEIEISYTVALYNPQPTAALTESLSGNLTTLAPRVGPAFVTYETSSSTGVTFQFRVPGTYTVSFWCNVTTNSFGTPTLTPPDAGTINNSFAVASANRFAYIANITVITNANLTFVSLTGLSNFQIFVTRASKADAVVVT